MTEEVTAFTSGNELSSVRGESDSNGGSDKGQNSQRGAGRQRAMKLPSIDGLLIQLLNLNGAVIMGAMKATDAALINRNIKTVLDVQMRRISRDEGTVDSEALIDRCRRDPSILEVVSSFLSPQQVDDLMREVMDDDRDDSA